MPKKTLKLLPPWFEADTHPEEGAPIVMWDGMNIHAGVWTTKVGRASGEGGFATVTRKVDKNSTTHTKITLVDNIKAWMPIPSQERVSL
jgi:hypothetical protein